MAAIHGAQPIKVVIIDDVPLFLDGLSSLLATCPELDIVGVAANGADGLAICERLLPDVLLLDVMMPGQSGLEVLRALRSAQPSLKIIMLTSNDDMSNIEECMRGGANGYLLKINGKDEVLRAIEDVMSDRPYYDPKIMRGFFPPNRAGAPGGTAAKKTAHHASPLSPRETEVLTLIAQGKTSEHIGQELFIAMNTVDTHRKNIISKLDAKNVTEAVSIALTRGYI